MEGNIEIGKTGNDGSMKGKFINPIKKKTSRELGLGIK